MCYKQPKHNNKNKPIRIRQTFQNINTQDNPFWEQADYIRFRMKKVAGRQIYRCLKFLLIYIISLLQGRQESYDNTLVPSLQA